MAMYPEPTEICRGDTITWIRRNVVAYSANDDGTWETTEIKASQLWVLKFVAVGQLGVFSITAATDTENVDDFKFTALAAITAAYVVGDYQWQLVATLSTNRYTIAVGRVAVLDNIAARDALYDNRSHAKICLDNIEAVLQTRATRDQMAYQIAGRSLQLTPIADLLKLRNYYKAEYKAEIAALNMKSGRGSGRKILTRFVIPGN